MEYREKLRELGITLEKTGKQICPKCSASRKNKTDKCLSVTFDTDAVLYNCHHCGWSGSVFYKQNKHFKQYNRPAEFKNKEDISPLIRYFAKRGISENTLKKYKIGYNDKNQIIFPYYKNGVLVNIKTRENLGNGKKTFTQTKDAEKTFFGIDFVKEEENLIIVEGEVDVLSLAEQGINAVSVPQGGSDKKLECLSNCSDEFIQSFKTFIIATDNDEVGKGLRDNLIERIPRDKCKIVEWGQYKDANEALVAGENLHQYIDKAKYLSTEGIFNFNDKWDLLYTELFEEDKNFYKTGWQDFDELVKIRTGYLMVVSGYPSRGKSYFVKNLLINLSKNYGLKHLIASFEDTIGSLYRDLFQMYMQKTIFKIKQENKEQAIEKILIDDNYSFICDHFEMFENDRLWDIDQIIEKTEIEYIKKGIKVLVIDPYNRLKNDYSEREDKYIGNILAKLCMLAKRLNILVIFIAHPKKPEKGEANTPPNLYSVSGSGDWYNMPDYGIIIHRDRKEDGKLEDEVKVIVQKIKNFALGDPKGGTIILKFNSQKMVIENKE